MHLKNLILLTVGLVMGFSLDAGAGSGSEKAFRYKVKVASAALGYARGYTYEIEELYLSQRGIVLNLSEDYPNHVANAFFSPEMRNSEDSPTEWGYISTDLADEAERLAKAVQEVKNLQEKLGKDKELADILKFPPVRDSLFKVVSTPVSNGVRTKVKTD